MIKKKGCTLCGGGKIDFGMFVIPPGLAPAPSSAARASALDDAYATAQYQVALNQMYPATTPAPSSPGVDLVPPVTEPTSLPAAVTQPLSAVASYSSTSAANQPAASSVGSGNTNLLLGALLGLVIALLLGRS